MLGLPQRALIMVNVGRAKSRGLLPFRCRRQWQRLPSSQPSSLPASSHGRSFNSLRSDNNDTSTAARFEVRLRGRLGRGGGWPAFVGLASVRRRLPTASPGLMHFLD